MMVVEGKERRKIKKKVKKVGMMCIMMRILSLRVWAVCHDLSFEG